MNHFPTPSAAAPQGPKLRDIHLPAAPPWWPPAPGWWILAALALVGVAVAVWLWRRRRKVVAKRRRVLREVDHLVERYRGDSDHAALAAGLHQLLRRVARQHHPGATQQTGVSWRQTLARVPVQASVLDHLMALDELMYRSQPSFDHVALVNDVRAWLQLALKPSTWKKPTVEPTNA